LVRLLQSQEKGRAGLDKLVAKLRRQVLERTSAAPQLMAKLGKGRHRLLGAELHIQEAGKSLLRAIRFAEVSAYDYDRDVLVSAVVDLDTGAIKRIVDYQGLQPPPTKEEAAEAADIVAATQPVLAKQLRARRIVPSAVNAREASIAEHACYRHRALYVFFWTGAKQLRRVAGPFLVDLSRRRVVPLERDY
jgi:hypothetical protein